MSSLSAYNARAQYEASKKQLAELERARMSQPVAMPPMFSFAPEVTGSEPSQPQEPVRQPVSTEGERWGGPLERVTQALGNAVGTMRTAAQMPTLDEAKFRIERLREGNPVSEAGPGMGPNLATGEDYLIAGLDAVTPIPIKGLISAPVGGRSAIGLLGKKIPETSKTIDEMLDESGYKLGSAPGIYQHAVDPKAVRHPARLSREEQQMIREYGKEWTEKYGKDESRELQKQARANVIDYRETHSPREGFTIAEPAGFEIKEGAKQPAAKVKVKYKDQAPQFQTNPTTGAPWTGEERSLMVEDTSNKLIGEVQQLIDAAGQGNRNAQYIVDQSQWYTKAQNLITDLFGVKGGKLYADIQGAMSPNTRLVEQHKMAQEFFERTLDGDFNKQLQLFDEHMAKKPQGVTESSWANQLFDKRSDAYNPDAIPLKRNGTKFGIHSADAMMAVRDMIGSLEPGMAPKMRNFAANLRGDSPDPTIDVWAGRTINRLTNEERVPPVTKGAVLGEMATNPKMLKKGHAERAEKWLQKQNSPAYKKGMEEYKAQVKAARAAGEKPPPMPKKLQPPQDVLEDMASTPDPMITGQYGIARDIYNTAAAKLGMSADDLQALMWFAEKEAWEAKGFTQVDVNASLVDLIRKDNPPSARLNELRTLSEQYR